MDIASFLGGFASSSPPLVAALLIGIITSIGPCPLGANLAAVAFIAKKAQSRAIAVVQSVSYAIGRALTYLIIAGISAILGITANSVLMPLQSYSDLLLSFILAICGLMLLGKISINLNFMNTEKLRFLADHGSFGAFLFGGALALVFCPVSAALFFGALLPIVLLSGDWLFIPIVYGVGTALPVLLAVPALHTAGKVGRGISVLSKLSVFTDYALGWMFILGSIYYLLVFARLI